MTENIENKMRRTFRTKILCLFVLTILPIASGGQELSYDGKRWFEVEVSVFTNEYFTAEYSEIPVAAKFSPQYYPRLQKLLTPISSLMIDFPKPVTPTVLQLSESINVAAAALEEPPLQIGPVYSPAVRGAFKINDYSRDAFIALADRVASFNSLNRNLTGSSEHRILWHQVWRQPLQPRAQTPAIFVIGGEHTANHAELEGNLRVSDLSGNATVDINLWLIRFENVAQAENDEEAWRVPDLPLPLDDNPVIVDADATVTVEDPRTIAAVWQLQQTEGLGTNQLYYFDHPAFGVLIQLRPYLLPEPVIITDEADF